MFAPLQNIYIELCLRQIVPFPQSTLALPCFVRYFGSSLRYTIEGPCPNIVFNPYRFKCATVHPSIH